MPQPDLFANEVETLSIGTFSKKAYLDYSMYVILDRALPFIGDGLKPVQRRIVFAMSELGLMQSSKFKKSARTVGDVLGKFHPHGDSACYEAMVLMAQTFSTRYPYIDGQGNWGSPDDPKSFAAMRYTESRLTNYSALLLDELAYDTTKWMPNFDGTLKEPKYLPAKVPNILLNGASGIAVGMATDILPHNLNEVMDATVSLIDNPDSSLDDITKYIKGPDFPSKAEIITKPNDIYNIYKTGQGSIRQRATYQVQGNKIIIETLPYQASLVKIIEQIAAQVVSKKLPIVTDIQDESDHTCPVRLVLSTKAKKDQMDPLMLHLFATTDLEKQYRANFNIIGLDGKPALKNLVGILKEWLDFRVEVVEKRLKYQLDKVNARLLILEALFVVYNNLDEIIHIIRTEDEPKAILIKRFAFTDIQAEAILNTKLRHLAKLEEEKLNKEKSGLEKEQSILEKHLSSKGSIKKLIKKELLLIKNDQKRNSQIVEKKPALSSKFDLNLTKEPITVVMSKLGWIRAAKGHDIDAKGLPFRPLDDYLSCVATYSNQNVSLYDSYGKFYNILVIDLPSARGHGEPITAKLNMPQGAKILGIFDMKKTDIALVGSNGYGFVTKTPPLVKTKLGLPALRLDDDIQAVPPVSLESYTHLALITNKDNMLVITKDEIPVKTKSKGNKLVSLLKDEFVITIKECNADKGIKLKKNISSEKLKKYLGKKGNKPKTLPFKNI